MEASQSTVFGKIVCSFLVFIIRNQCVLEQGIKWREYNTCLWYYYTWKFLLLCLKTIDVAHQVKTNDIPYSRYFSHG